MHCSCQLCSFKVETGFVMPSDDQIKVLLCTTPHRVAPGIDLVAACRKQRPRWLQLLLCRNFGSIALVSAIMFMPQNGARGVLLPLLAMQGFGLSAKLLGEQFYRANPCPV